jgi:rubredoxin
MNTLETLVSAEHPAPITDAAFKTWQCILCGFVYSEAEGMPDHGIRAGTRWADVPEDWICPDCSAGKGDFEMMEI